MVCVQWPDGYRLPMTWPFLGAVGSTTAIAPTAPATTLTPAQQLVLAPRTAQRRRNNVADAFETAITSTIATCTTMASCEQTLYVMQN
ncbi:hypothetical protein Bhyg_05478 [Pseudolycoriella hygida]|uniref:Uncharacterized protein n=1 Tax=Pseudolycoriella hygida TaxID=35572 RepID=A0A9Q0MYX1_9DIPT|nr:hypothetical protein Bhyg_05478 [Pseudolycoriella hygida]